jgi:aryl-phospho-beta-D-glucosidase BglC (GH1 family)
MKKTISAAIIALFGFANSAMAYQVYNGKIVDKHVNDVVEIDGVNWSGFQDSNVLDELWGAIPFNPYPNHYTEKFRPIGAINMLKNPWDFSDLTSDLAKNKPRITKDNSIAFKTIRLPIAPSNLRDNENVGKYVQAFVDQRDRKIGNGIFFKWENNQAKRLGITDSLYSVITEFKDQGLRVLVDFHQPAVGPEERDGTVVRSNYPLTGTQSYQSDVALLAKEIKDRNLTNVIGIDVFNEPHKLHWFESNGNQPTWADVIATAAQAVYDNNPNLLLFVEGPGSDEDSVPICLAEGSLPPNNPAYKSAYSTKSDANACGNLQRVTFESNWGENFRALLDQQEAKQGRAKMGTALRDHLAKKLNADVLNWLLGDQNSNGAHIVFSPHLYGAHVANGWQSSPEVSPHRFKWNFEFLQNAGYPVVIGESGYKLLDESQTNHDKSFFDDSVVPYLIKQGMQHNLFYWTFNTSSGDTGGVRDSGENPIMVVEKETSLHKLFNAK